MATIEQNLERIADAIERLTVIAEPATASWDETCGKATPAPAPASGKKGGGGKKTAEPQGKDPEKLRDEVREALRAYRKNHAKESAKEILESLGAPSVSALPEDKLGAALKAFSDG